VTVVSSVDTIVSSSTAEHDVASVVVRWYDARPSSELR
jgi:hypothetical protein